MNLAGRLDRLEAMRPEESRRCLVRYENSPTPEVPGKDGRWYARGSKQPIEGEPGPRDVAFIITYCHEWPPTTERAGAPLTVKVLRGVDVGDL